MNMPRDVISASELAQLQDMAEAALIDLVSVWRKTVTTDAYGAPVETWAEVAADVPFSLEAKTSKEQVQGGALKAITLWMGQAAVGTDVLPQDRIVKDDLTFEVTDTDAGATNAAVLTVQMVKVNQ
jgi:head-tail adaptor